MKTLNQFIVLCEQFLFENKVVFHKDLYKKSPVEPTHDEMAMDRIKSGSLTVDPEKETPECPHVVSEINRHLGGTQERPHKNLDWAVNGYKRTRTEFNPETREKKKVSDGSFKLEDMEHVSRSVNQFNHPEIQKYMKQDHASGGEFSPDINKYRDHHQVDSAVAHIRKKYGVDLSPKDTKKQTDSKSLEELEKNSRRLIHSGNGFRVYETLPDGFRFHRLLYGGGEGGNTTKHPDAIGTNWCTASSVHNFNHYNQGLLAQIHSDDGEVHQFASCNGELQKPKNNVYAEHERNEMFDDLIRKHPELPKIEQLQGLHKKFPLSEEKKNRIQSALDNKQFRSLSNGDYLVATNHEMLKPEHIDRIVDDPENIAGHLALCKTDKMSLENARKISNYPKSIWAHHAIAQRLIDYYDKHDTEYDHEAEELQNNIFSHPNSVGAQTSLILNGFGNQEQIDKLFSHNEPNQAHMAALMRGYESDNVKAQHIKFASDNVNRLDEEEHEQFLKQFKYGNHPLFNTSSVIDNEDLSDLVNKGNISFHHHLVDNHWDKLTADQIRIIINRGEESIHNKILDTHADKRKPEIIRDICRNLKSSYGSSVHTNLINNHFDKLKQEDIQNIIDGCSSENVRNSVHNNLLDNHFDKLDPHNRSRLLLTGSKSLTLNFVENHPEKLTPENLHSVIRNRYSDDTAKQILLDKHWDKLKPEHIESMCANSHEDFQHHLIDNYFDKLTPEQISHLGKNVHYSSIQHKLLDRHADKLTPEHIMSMIHNPRVVNKVIDNHFDKLGPENISHIIRNSNGPTINNLLNNHADKLKPEHIDALSNLLHSSAETHNLVYSNLLDNHANRLTDRNINNMFNRCNLLSDGIRHRIIKDHWDKLNGHEKTIALSQDRFNDEILKKGSSKVTPYVIDSIIANNYKSALGKLLDNHFDKLRPEQIDIISNNSPWFKDKIREKREQSPQ